MRSQAVIGNDLEAAFSGFAEPVADNDALLANEVARERAARLGAGAPRIN